MKVSTELGDFVYDSTPVELFAQRLARHWKLDLPESLVPNPRFSFLGSGYYLMREGRSDGKRASYFKHGKEHTIGESEDLKLNAERLYNGQSLDHEFVILEKGNKFVTMRVEPQRKIEVKFQDHDALAAVREAELEGLIQYGVPHRTDTVMDFSNVAPRESSGQPNNLGNLQAAFSVVTKYFSK